MKLLFEAETHAHAVFIRIGRDDVWGSALIYKKILHTMIVKLRI